MFDMRQGYTFNLSGSNYRKISSGDRVFVEYLGEDTNQSTNEEVEIASTTKKQHYEIGDVNKYGEMKISNTGTSKDWVYVGKKGKDHPKVKHLFQ